ncbi:MAG: hypothetical protein WCQ53_08960, partial [bacterium]
MMQQKLPIDFEGPATRTRQNPCSTTTPKATKVLSERGSVEINKTMDYSFGRLSTKEEKCWNDVVSRFVGELVKRRCKTSQEDLEWLCMNYFSLPNSPALLTAGTQNFHASACSSYPIKDTMDETPFSILDTLRISSMATKAGIGTGFNFSSIRSKDEPVRGRIGV